MTQRAFANGGRPIQVSSDAPDAGADAHLEAAAQFLTAAAWGGEAALWDYASGLRAIVRALYGPPRVVSDSLLDRVRLALQTATHTIQQEPLPGVSSIMFSFSGGAARALLQRFCDPGVVRQEAPEATLDRVDYVMMTANDVESAARRRRINRTGNYLLRNIAGDLAWETAEPPAMLN